MPFIPLLHIPPVVQLSSGFVGADTFNFSYAGSLLAANTFGGEVAALLALLAAVRWLAHGPAPGPKCIGGDSGSQDAWAAQQRALSRWCAYRLWLLVASAGCCVVHRRHLMVWAVFAPKLAFEASFWGVVGTTALLLSTAAAIGGEQ